MTPHDFLRATLEPGAAWCSALPGWRPPFDERARVMLLAIAGQESNWSARVQAGNGPAHGFWQFEKGGGVTGVLTDPVTLKMALSACAAAKVRANPTRVWDLFATADGDRLATAFARLLLWSDPAPLPLWGDEEGAWECYLRLWRPGKPDRRRWTGRYDSAIAAIKGDAN